MDQLREAEHVAVVVDELVHVPELDVADAMVDLKQRQATGGRRGLLDLAVARHEHAVVIVAIDERVNYLAIRPNGRPAQDAVFAAIDLGRLHDRHGATLGCLAPCALDVVNEEGDVLDAITVAMDVLGNLAVWSQWRSEDEADVVLDHQVRRAVAHLGLEAGKATGG